MPIFNDKFIRAIAPSNKDKVYWDDSITGLGLKITKNNSKSFFLRYVINRKERKIKIGNYPDINYTAAKEIAYSLKGDIAKGQDPHEVKKAAYDCLTFKEFSEEFLKAKEKSLKPRTLKDYKTSFLGKYLLPKFGNYRLNEINKKDVEILHSSFSKIPRMGNRCLQLLCVMFNVAISWEIIDKNPAKGIKKFTEHKRERYLSTDEINKLRQTLDSDENQINANAIRLILLTGSRKSEVLSARWQDFDFENNLWIKPAALTKQNKVSRIPLNSEAWEIVRKMKEKIVPNNKLGSLKENQIVSSETHLFYNPKTKTNIKDIKKFWASICEKTGFENAHIHDLRHTFASILVSNGVGLEVIGKLIERFQLIFL